MKARLNEYLIKELITKQGQKLYHYVRMCKKHIITMKSEAYRLKQFSIRLTFFYNNEIN